MLSTIRERRQKPKKQQLLPMPYSVWKLNVDQDSGA